MGAIILLMAQTSGDYTKQGVVIAALLLNLLLALFCLLTASQLQRILGVTGIQVLGRVMGVLLSALAVQFIFNGIINAQLFSQ